MQKKLRIIPWVRGLPTERLKSLYDRIVQDGTHDIVFFDGSVNSVEDFLDIVSREVLFLVTSTDLEDVGFVRLNRFDGRKANAHFCVFSALWGHPELCSITRWVNQRILRTSGPDGYAWDMIWGLIPVTNPRAIRFTQRIGGVDMGVMPNALLNRHGESVDGHLHCQVREEGEYESIYQMRD